MPTGASLTRNPMAMKRAALAIDGFISRDRNDGVDAGRHLPARTPSWPAQNAASCSKEPSGPLRPLRCGTTIRTINGDRLTLSFAKGAAACGAVLANYVEAIRTLKLGERLAGVNARDNLTGQVFDVRARILVNAGGPWAATLFDRSGVQRYGYVLLVPSTTTTYC